jgi:outer membrane biosynthesis protein TonB
MSRQRRLAILTGLLLLAPVLVGCADVDFDKLDIFGITEKKKLAGERKPVFPEGVPGVTQGIPPEYIKGNQPSPQDVSILPPEPPKAVAAAPEPKPKRKPKPKIAAKPKPPQVTVTRAPQNAAPAPAAVSAQPSQPPAATSAPWPGQNQSSNSAPWPAAPPPNTFSR